MAKRRSRSRRKSNSLPGWLWMLAGLGLGLSVAAAVYLSDLRPRATQPPPRPAPQSQQEMEAPMKAPAEAHPAERFDFYELLPKFEVVIPESERDARPDASPAAVEQPGNYVLQAGSFSTYTDADRMRAQLALLGVESRIQKVSIDDRTYHRVRVGPITNLDELNSVRGRLRDARVEVMVIRLDGR